MRQEVRNPVLTQKFDEDSREKARRIITERVAYYRQFIQEPVGKIRIKDQKTRWGSCSSKGNLNFNWRLMLMPGELLDYVVVHELCHLKYMNHSPQFWAHVGEILPDYQERRRRLRMEEW